MEKKRNLFYVKGEPFIALAGEAHNSNSSTPSCMEGVWDKAAELGLNTVLLPVTWELVEPVEGTFEFATQDTIIAQARERGMHIIFLWFGTWKNAQCSYAPEWVKKDLERFPRAQVEKGMNKCRLQNFHGMPYSSLSYLGEETCKADARAFAAFMAHLKEVDEAEQTVIAVQVENETGLQGTARERSDLADEVFARDVQKHRKTCARAEIHGVKLFAQFVEIYRFADDGVEFHLDAEFFEVFDFFFDDFFRQTEFRNTVNQHAARFVEGFVNGDVHTRICKVARQSQTARAAADDCHRFADSFWHFDFDVFMKESVSDKPFQRADCDRTFHSAPYAVFFALRFLRADSAAD